MKKTKCARHIVIENIVCSVWTKRILCLLMILLQAVHFYVLMFVGHGNTYVDEVCYFSTIVCCVIVAACRIVREYLLYKNEKEVD